MTERTTDDITAQVLEAGAALPQIEPQDEFAVQIADQVASFLIALKAVATEGNPGTGISLLLLEISQLLLAGARLGAQIDFTPTSDYQPDVGPDADLDELRLRLADLFGDVDTYSFVFDPYDPEQVESQLSDDLSQIAADLENGLRHFALGNTAEALWWWQFSYVSSWGNLAGAILNALLSIVTHDRLDVEYTGELDRVAAANEMLEGTPHPIA
jgi:hypothetical protein